MYFTCTLYIYVCVSYMYIICILNMPGCGDSQDALCRSHLRGGPRKVSDQEGEEKTLCVKAGCV